MLTIKDLTYSYNESGDGLKNVSVDFEKGIVGIIGANGSGKTTLFRLLSNALQAPSGTIFFNDKDISADQLYGKSHISICFDTPSLISRMTVQENLHYYNILFKKPAGKIEEILEELDLNRYRDYPIKKLSFGLKQRVNIGAMLLRDADVLMFDEPFNGLDPQNVTTLRALLNKYRERNKCIIVSAHILPEIEKVGDHVVILHHGRIIFNDVNPQKYGVKYSLIACPNNAENLAAMKEIGIKGFTVDASVIKLAMPDDQLDQLNHIANYEVKKETSLLEDIYYNLST